MSSFTPKPKAAVTRNGPITSIPVQTAATGRGGAVPVVQINFRCSAEMAEIWAEYAKLHGGSRMALAKILKKMGLPVPAIDLETNNVVRASMMEAEARKRGLKTSGLPHRTSRTALARER